MTDAGPDRFALLVCDGPVCGDDRGSAALYRQARDAVAAPDLADCVYLGRRTCFGQCLRGPNVLVAPVAPDHFGADPEPGSPGAVLHFGVTTNDMNEMLAKLRRAAGCLKIAR